MKYRKLNCDVVYIIIKIGCFYVSTNVKIKPPPLSHVSIQTNTVLLNCVFFSSSCLLLIMISALGHAVCRPHNKKGPRACRAVYSFSKVSSVWEEPWSATLFLFIIYVFTKTKFVLCAVFLIWNRLTVCTGVLHGAVVLITELCERNPDTLDQFRKVIFSRSYTLTIHRCTDHLWYFPSHYIRLFLNWFRSWKVLWHPAILQSTT